MRIRSGFDAFRLGAILALLWGAPPLAQGGMLDTPLPTFSDSTPALLAALIPTVIKNHNIETDVICTNLHTAPVHIGLQVFDDTGALQNAIGAGNGALLNVGVGATVTIGTGSTAVLTENAVIASLTTLRNGSGRAVATSANIACTALLVDRLHVVVAPAVSPQRPPTLARLPVCSAADAVECGAGGTASEQIILGKVLLVKDPKPPGNPTGVDPSKRKVTVQGKENASANVVLGNPLANGATVTLFANGTVSSQQTISIPAGINPGGSAHGWTVTAGGFRFRNLSGTAPIPVKSVDYSRSAAGTFALKVKLDGRFGAIAVAPPKPGTGGGVILTIGGGGGSYCVNFGGAAGGKVINVPTSPTNPTPLAKTFKIVATSSAPTVEAGCPAP